MAIKKDEPLQPDQANPMAENVLPKQPTQKVNINETYIKVPGSNFGYKDSQDNGVGCWGVSTNNEKVVGASLPIKTTASLFNGQKNGKAALVEIYNPQTNKTLLAPLVDVGPGERIKYGIDLTYNCFQQLGGKLQLKGNHIVGGSGLYEILYRVLSPEEQNQYAHLRDGQQGAGHVIPSPMRDTSKFVDLMSGTNVERNAAIAEMAKGSVPDYPAAVAESPAGNGSQGAVGAETSAMHTTTPITPSPVNTSGMPTGMFSIPEVGAMLWVFFRGGDPMFPVYFAASYGEQEWASAYSAASPPMYYPGTDPKKYSKQDAAFMMPNKGGGLQAIEAVDKENVSNSNRSIKLFGYSGAHLELGEQQNVYYAPREDYHQVDGNKFDMVMGNREFFTRGDCNIFAQGSLIMKGGNTSQNALQAMDSINEVVNNVNSSMSGGGSTSDGSHLA